MKKLIAIVVCTYMITGASGASGAAVADDGASTYKLVCSSCHESGALNAPKLKDEVEWIHRIRKGMDALYASTVNGKCTIAVKDLRKDLSDEEIKDAVDYMVSQVKHPIPFQN